MAGETLTALLADCAAMAKAPALIYGGREVSFAELDEGARRAAAGLAELGVKAGDRVALWLANAPAWLELYFACARLGAIVVCVNTRFRAVEVEDIVGRSGAKVLAMWPGFKGIDFAGIVRDVDPAALDQLETVITYAEGGEGEGASEQPIHGKRTVSYDDVRNHPPMARDHASPEAGIHIFTTSGTTKAPKFVLHNQAAAVRHGRDVARHYGYDRPETVTLMALPLCGAYGLSQQLAALAGKRPTVLMPTFEARTAGELIREYGVTAMNGADEMYLRMVEAFDEPKPFPTLARCGYASFNSEPLETLRTLEERGLPCHGQYGMSEVHALFAAQPLDASQEQRAMGGGIPVSSDTRCRARDPESGEILPDGEAGELELKGPSQMAEYFGEPGETAKTVTEDGYIRTGDLGYTTGYGFVFLSRMGDALRLGGYLVNPLEIAAHIEQLETVEACQVVGVNPGRGTVAVGFVIPAAGCTIDEEAVIHHCKQGLAPFKVPARVVAIDEFPVAMSANGVKIQRGRLRDKARAALDITAAGS